MLRIQRPAIAFSLSLLLSSSACDQDANGELPGDDPSSDELGTTGADDPEDDPNLAYDCIEPNLTEMRPLVGPGFAPGQGLIGELRENYIVHTTQLLVHPEQMENFLMHGDAITAQLDTSEGLLAYGIAYHPTCGFQRTLGIWRDEAAMYSFVGSGAHAKAMTATLELSSTGKVMHWQATPDEVNALNWNMAMAKLAEEPVSGIYP